ncbi:hypothetical protein N7494_003868 [Penicillium frequentans]|uniref:Zn(2)-C6 fungal-type domain-containing protein n=1 Tax=Penicillium frequentans TaxID=3151616 RepID=A0AAD6GIB6_9EURO|nr:hypothetical protein N7494_003868 [Penicillium glabrum]
MPRVPKAPVKAACLACRSSKTRCDGQYPCKVCYSKGRECSYQPSRRGGARRGIRYTETLQRHAQVDDAPSEPLIQPRASPIDVVEIIDPLLENTMGLLTPFVGIQNLDLSPDVLSDTGEALQLWGQLTPGDDGSYTSPSINDVDLPAIRAYQCEQDILNAYYIYMHPYFPLLPPSPNSQYEDRSTFFRPSKQFEQPKKTDLPYWPVSSLSLALSAILVLIPPIPDSSSMNEPAVLLRRSYAQLFAQAALVSVEREIDELSPASSINIIGASPSQEQSALHSKVPIQLDPILALVVLAMYEYCQRGNVSRMRARVNHAVTTAMDLCLHDLGSTSTEYSEAQRRAWWMIMFVAYISSNLHLAPPIIASDDPRITTPLPRFGVNTEPWGLTIRVQKLLYAAHSMVQKIESVADSPLLSNLGEEIKNLDAQIVVLTIESDQSLRETFDFEGESYIAENMWRISRIMINTARIRLHRFRAFIDIPLFLDRYCDLISINSHGFSHPSPSNVAHWQSTFPFTEQESSNICLKSSLVIANAFRSLPYPHPCGPETCKRGSLNRRVMVRSPCCVGRAPRTVPFLGCSAMQGSYTLLMLSHRVRSCLESGRLASCYHLLGRPEPATEISDAERLIEELKHAVESLGLPVKQDNIFEGIAGVGHEIESAYLAAFPDSSPIAA